MADAPALVERAPRVVIPLRLDHADSASGTPAADQAEDISLTGLFVRCQEPYTVGTVVRLQLDIPGCGAPLDAHGCVVRVGSGGSGHTGMGIMFTSLTGVSRAMIERVILAATPEQPKK